MNPSTPAEAARLIDNLAWVHVVDGRLLLARSRGKDLFYLPGGKREPGESDHEALAREVQEELSVEIRAEQAEHLLTLQAPAHGQPGAAVRMACYRAPAQGSPVPSAEIEEIAWLTLEEAEAVAPAARAVMEQLTAQGILRRQTPARRAVLFDLDDTLLVTREAKWEQSRFVARTHFGFELTDAELEAAWGKPFETMIAEQYRNSASLAEMIAANDASEDQYPKRVVPGAPETVQELRALGLRLGVVTSTRTAKAEDQLLRTGFDREAFDLVQGPESTAFHKPDGRVFEPALQRLAAHGITAAEVVYVGDSALDRAAALGAGLDLVAIASPLARDAAPEGHRPPVVPDVTAVPAALGLRPVDPSGVYELVAQAPDVHSYRHLRQASGLSPKSEAQARPALRNSWAWAHVRVRETGETVAMGRVLGDGGWYFHVADMATLPQHQRHGLGRWLLGHLLERIRSAAGPEAYVTLMGDRPGRRLYRSMGFRDAMPHSMGMVRPPA